MKKKVGNTIPDGYLLDFTVEGEPHLFLRSSQIMICIRISSLKCLSLVTHLSMIRIKLSIFCLTKFQAILKNGESQ